MIQLRPYDDLSAMSVFQRLDAHDRMEAEMMRGAVTTHLSLFADWRAVQPGAILSYIALTSPDLGSVPFAVLVLGNTGQAGVAQAALLARNHAHFRRPLAELAALIRHDLPPLAMRLGIHRIEARSWTNHPTAARLLTSLGFHHECAMPGFGSTGMVWFHQFAWVAPLGAPVIPTAPPSQP